MRRFSGLWIFVLVGISVACTDDNRRQARIPPLPENSAQMRNQAALEALTRAINQNAAASAYAKRAALYLQSNRTEEALGDIEQALDRDNNEGRYHFIRAQILRSRHQFNDALESALRAEGLGVNTPELYLAIGDLYQEIKEYDRARLYVVKALQMSPFDGDAFYFNGLVSAKMGDTARAIAYFRRSLTLKPRNLSTYVQMADIHSIKGDIPSAMTYAQRGLGFFPNHPRLFFSKGLAYQLAGKSDSAYQFYQRAIQLDPKFTEAHFQAGLVMLKWRNPGQALYHFGQVSTQNPAFPRLHYYTALGYEQSGQWEQAGRMYSLAMQDNPAAQPAYYQQAYYGYWRVQKRQAGYYGNSLLDAPESDAPTRPGTVLDTTRVRVMTIRPRSGFGADTTRR
ncbi:tetratricopeptide repeat protein [Larkinella soli]|uniref:tetratricopeptide repeat protein n=1 Tax=Larkinella soli TaxID=1770527 RepID=UPI000FFCB0C2|nr:tetratricopeptide repeat protein [Larkinella soli]